MTLRWERAGWTPDFARGLALLSVEEPVTRIHLERQAGALLAAACHAAARPEDLRRPWCVWTAVALDATCLAFQWRRTRTWRSLRVPEVGRVAPTAAVATSWLAMAGTTPPARSRPTGWPATWLETLAAGIGFTAPSHRSRAAHVALLLAPLARPGARGNGTAVAAATRLAIGAGSVVATVELGRRRTAEVQRTADDTVLAAAHRTIAEETAAFELHVTRPVSDRMREIATLAATDARRAREAATDLVQAIRRWLHENGGPGEWEPALATAHAADAQSEHARGDVLRTFEVIGAATGLVALVELVGADDRERADGLAGVLLAARALRAAAAARNGASAAAESSRQPGQRLAARVALDLAAVAATTAAELRSAAGPSPASTDRARTVAEDVCRTARLLVPASAQARRSGASTDRLPEQRPTPLAAACAAARVVAAVRAPRPPARRLAAVAAELVHTLGRDRLSGVVAVMAVAEAEHVVATAHDEAIATHAAAVRHARVARAAALHDGPLQVLGAIAAAALPTRDLLAWLDRETDDLSVAVRTVGRPRSVAIAVGDATRRCAATGVRVDLRLPPLPPWTDRHGETVGLVVGEALANVGKHTCATSALVAVTADDDRLRVVVADAATAPHPEATPSSHPHPAVGAASSGAGTGTRRMAILAELAGGTIAWRRRPDGGTDVELVLRRQRTGPTPRAEEPILPGASPVA